MIIVTRTEVLNRYHIFKYLSTLAGSDAEFALGSTGAAYCIIIRFVMHIIHSLAFGFEKVYTQWRRVGTRYNVALCLMLHGGSAQYYEANGN